MPDADNSLKEYETFEPDKAKTAKAKNKALAKHLDGGVWRNKKIVKINRIEIGSQTGWKATYRK